MERLESETSLSYRCYARLLALYPAAYIEKHGAEMLQNFLDLERDSSSAIALWAFISKDFFISSIRQHMYTNSRAAIFAFLLFIPFIAMVAITIVAHATAGSSAGSGPIAAFVAAHTALAFSFIFVLPAVGVTAVALDMAADLARERSWNPLRSVFLRDHLGAALAFVLGIAILLFLPTHDTIPCIVHGITTHGLGNVLQLVANCRNA